MTFIYKYKLDKFNKFSKYFYVMLFKANIKIKND